MKLTVLQRKNKAFSAFSFAVWPAADREHYGFEGDWKRRKLYLRITNDKKEIIGILEMHILGGVAEVIALIIQPENRGKGLGTMLMNKAEEVAKKYKAHKIYLTTGKKWASVEFYQSLGYKKSGELINHWQKHDFYQFEKNIKK